MLEFLERLLQAAGIEQAHSTMKTIPATGVVALPANFTERDLEKYLPNRRRQRGTMKTHIIGDFMKYVSDMSEPGAQIFVDEAEMSATAVLNLGNKENPGHADNLAILVCRQTAAYMALIENASGRPRTQVQIAEFMEDWRDNIQCFGPDNNAVSTTKSIAAVRAITIEGIKRLRSEEQALSANKTTFESVTAASEETLPALIRFKCEPYAGFSEREFFLRLGILTTDKPAITLRIIKAEEHMERMGLELSEKLEDEGGANILLGKYTKA